jgi:endonuclease/exonuclease/phosphatase (EEP) superfamily protein YafD
MKKSLINALRYLALFSLLVILSFTVASYLGTLNRWFEITSHFRVQYLVATCAPLLLLISLKAWRWAGLAGLCLLLNGIAVLPWLVTSSQPDRPPHKLRLLLANVNAANTNYPALLHLVEREKPDLLIVQEASESWLRALEPLRATYPHWQFVANRDHAGMALYSRFPVEPFEAVSAEVIDFPCIATRLRLDEARLTLISLHPPPPATDDFLRERNRQLLKVAEMVKQSPHPAIVAGDLNISVWSPYYSEFVKRAGLGSARRGFGILPTWPAHNRLIAIPIDHCLISDGLQISNCRTGSEIGSDHLPLITDIAF